MKLLQSALVISLLTLTAHAFGQNPVNLTQQDTTGYFWDAGNSQYGQTALQLYPAYVPNEPSQQFLWTPTPTWTTAKPYFTICSLAICLSDKGTGSLIMGAAKDVFVITGTDAVMDVTTGRYVDQPAKPVAGSFITMGTTATPWAFALAAAQPVTPPVTPPVTTTTIDLMPLGDSITQGYPTTQTLAQGGYRCPLYTLLAAKGINAIAEGYGANIGIQCQTGWEGHYGYTIQQIETMEVQDGAVTIGKPQYVTLIAGTNDVAAGESASTIGANLTALINNVVQQSPNVHIFLSTIPPMNPAVSAQIAGWSAQVPAANVAIKAVAASFGTRVTLVDGYAALISNVPGNSADGVHLTVAGYDILANLFATAITNYVK